MAAPVPDPLERLLRRADEAAPPLPALRVAPADLLALAAGRRKRRRRAWAAAAAALLLAVPAGWLLLPSASTTPSPPAASLAEVASCQAEAAERFRVLERLRTRREGARLARRLEGERGRTPYAERAAGLLDEAVGAMAWRADRLLAADRAEAARIYRAIAAGFPQTRWSVMAEQKLAAIEGPAWKENER